MRKVKNHHVTQPQKAGHSQQYRHQQCASIRWERLLGSSDQQSMKGAGKTMNMVCSWIYKLTSTARSGNLFQEALDDRSGEGNGTPLQYSCLENPMDRGVQWAAVHGVAKSQTRLSDFTFSCTGEGNGNPLQCSCLENPRDRGAWWASVYGVAQSQTRLKRLSSSSSMSITFNPNPPLEGNPQLPFITFLSNLFSLVFFQIVKVVLYKLLPHFLH